MRWWLLIAFAGWPASACICGGWPSAKDAWEDSPVVFLGRVVRTDPDSSSGADHPRGAQMAWVVVEEPFKGAHEDQGFVLKQPGHDCAPKFKAGERVVFYLHRAKESDAWEAHGCHRSRPIESAADDLLFLRALPSSARGTRLSGEVYEDTLTEGSRRFRPLSGVRVAISGGKHTVETITNTDGVYEIYGLAPDKYHVAIDVPRGLKITFPAVTGFGNARLMEAEVHLGRNAGASVSFFLRVDNQVSGRVLDSQGNPIEGVCVDPELDGDQAGRFSISGCTKSDGRYLLEWMPPGTYRIVANRSGRPIRQAPFPKLYYPGTFDAGKATVVSIGTGEHLSGFEIRVPTLPRRVLLSGRVQFSDGAPVSNGMVTFTSNNPMYIESTKTAKDGLFSFTIFSGMAGELHGEIFVDRPAVIECPQFAGGLKQSDWLTTFHTNPLPVAGDSDREGINLVFPFPSCKNWPNRR